MKKMIFVLTALTFLSPVMPVHAAGEKETANPLFFMKLKVAQARKKIAPTLEKIKESFLKNESLALCAIAAVSIVSGVLVVAGMEKFRTKKDEKNSVDGKTPAASVIVEKTPAAPTSEKKPKTVPAKPATPAKPVATKSAHVPGTGVESTPIDRSKLRPNQLPRPVHVKVTPTTPASVALAVDPVPTTPAPTQTSTPAAVPVDQTPTPAESQVASPASEVDPVIPPAGIAPTPVAPADDEADFTDTDDEDDAPASVPASILAQATDNASEKPATQTWGQWGWSLFGYNK